MSTRSYILPPCLAPFANHNQQARNVFASSMIKHSMQIVLSASPYHKGKYHGSAKKALATFIACQHLYQDEFPNGVNLVMAITPSYPILDTGWRAQ